MTEQWFGPIAERLECTGCESAYCWHTPRRVVWDGRTERSRWMYYAVSVDLERRTVEPPAFHVQPDPVVDGHRMCNGCGRFVPNENMRSVHGIENCYQCIEDRFVDCRDCEDNFDARETGSTVYLNGDSRLVCTPCWREYGYCEHCGDHFQGDECGCRDSGDCDCDECREAAEETGSGIVLHSYSYKPTPVFLLADGQERTLGQGRWGQYDKTLYLGFELEVEVSGGARNVAKRMSDAFGDVAYLKQDSSIECGFEIVTHPMTLDYAMQKFPWKVIREERRSRSIHADTNCGLHVHVSKAGFTGPAHEYRWLMFVYRNQRMFEAMARRSDNSYCEFGLADRSLFAARVKGNQRLASERYSAINVQNEATYEMRIFASTVYIDQLKAALQLAESSVEYTRHLASSKILSDGGFCWHEYVKWLSAQRGRYAVLLVEIGKRCAAVKPTAVQGYAMRPTGRYGQVEQGDIRSFVIQDPAMSRKVIA